MDSRPLLKISEKKIYIYSLNEREIVVMLKMMTNESEENRLISGTEMESNERNEGEKSFRFFLPPSNMALAAPST